MPIASPTRGQFIIAAIALVLGVYVFLPCVLMIPIFFAIEHHWLPESALESGFSIFAPLQFVSDHVPFYKKLLEAEFDFCMRVGWIPRFE